MANTPEYSTIVKMEDKLKIGFKMNLSQLATSFRKEKLIDEECYDMVSQVPSSFTKSQKATRMVQGVSTAVENSSNRFHTMMKILKASSIHSDLYCQLRDEYARQKEQVTIIQDSEGASAVEGKGPSGSSTPEEDVPENFSEDFNPQQFANWMKHKNFLPDNDCKIIVENGIAGFVFIELSEQDLKDYNFSRAGYINLCRVLRKVKKVTSEQGEVVPDSKGASKNDGKNFPETDRKQTYSAKDRGTYTPKLKLEKGDEIAKHEPKELIIPYHATGYYPMQAKKHGVCFIINNYNFKYHNPRPGTERDCYNLVETWQYLGYHVEVCEDATSAKILEFFEAIDDILAGIQAKNPDLANDSFVCCILSHGGEHKGENFILGSDSEEIKFTDIEEALGMSKILRKKPKLFFVQACRGTKLGTKAVPDNITYQADSGWISTQSHFYISNSTSFGRMSYRHPIMGSLYVGSLCKFLCQDSQHSTINELQEALTAEVNKKKVNGKGKDVYVQQPVGGSRLEQGVHFFWEKKMTSYEP